MKYTIEDLKGIVEGPFTSTQEQGLLNYINKGVIPKADPCLNCEPNVIRKMISAIQSAENHGMWPPKRRSNPKPPESTDKPSGKRTEPKKAETTEEAKAE